MLATIKYSKTAFRQYIERLGSCAKIWDATRKEDGAPHPKLFGAFRYPFALVCNLDYGERIQADSEGERLGNPRQEVSAEARVVELALLRSSSLVYSGKKKADYVTAPMTIKQLATLLNLGRSGLDIVKSGLAELVQRQVITATQVRPNFYVYKQKVHMGTSGSGERENYLMLFPEEIDLLLSTQSRIDVKLNLVNVWLVTLARSVTSKNEFDAAWVPIAQIATGCQLENKAVERRLDDLVRILLLSRRAGLVRFNDDKANKHHYYSRPWANFDLERRMVKDIQLKKINRTFPIEKDCAWLQHAEQNIKSLLYSIDKKNELDSVIADVS